MCSYEHYRLHSHLKLTAKIKKKIKERKKAKIIKVIIILLQISTNFLQLYLVLRCHKNRQVSDLGFAIISVTFHSELLTFSVKESAVIFLYTF